MVQIRGNTAYSQETVERQCFSPLCFICLDNNDHDANDQEYEHEEAVEDRDEEEEQRSEAIGINLHVKLNIFSGDGAAHVSVLYILYISSVARIHVRRFKTS